MAIPGVDYYSAIVIKSESGLRHEGINRYILLIIDKVSVFRDGSLCANHLKHQPPSTECYLCLELGNHSLQFV